MTDRTVVYRLRADAQQFSAQMKAAGASVRKAADDMTAANKEGAKFRQGLDSLGGAAGKVGLVAAVGLGVAVKKAADFDAAMSKVSAATGESAANMEKLRKAALDAGAETVFSAMEAADGIEQLAKAGVSTEAILSGGLKGALDLAAAGEMAVGDAAEVAAKAMAQFGLEGSQVPHIADLLASAAGNASGEVSDFGMALSQSGLVANQVGLSLEETTAGLAAFAEAGLLGSDAGTSFKTMLGALSPNSKQAADAMAYLGLSAYDAQGNFVGLSEFAGRLQTALKGMSDEQRQSTMETIFGSDAVRAASVLYEQGSEGIEKWISTVDDQGAAAEMAAKRLDNLKGDLEALSGAFETALISTGDGSQGGLRSLTQGLTDVVNGYNSLGDSAKNGVAVTLAATAALGGGLFVFTRAVKGIASTREAMDQLGISGGKASKAMKGLAGAATGLAVLTTATAAFRALQEATDESLPGVEAMTSRLIDMANLPTGFSGSIGAEFDSIADSIDRLTAKRADMKASDTIGSLVGIESGSLHDATREIELLDQSLTNLVSSGNSDLAAASLTTLADQYGLSADQVKRLMTVLPGYTDALAGQANDAKLAAGSTDALTSANDGLTHSAFKSQAQIKAEADAMKAAQDAANGTARGFVNLTDSVNDADVTLGQWITKLANQADALRNFRLNAEKAADNGLRRGLIEALREMGPEGAMRLKQLANATDEEIARANKAWQRGQNEIRKYVAETTKVPGEVSTVVKVDSTAASQRIASINAQLAAIDRNIVVNVGIHRGGGGESPYLSGGIPRKAGGGYITGPGTATSDSIPAYLSDGEYVVKAAAVDKYGVAMFDRLNAMHFAGGGSVNRSKKRKHSGAFDSATDFSPGELALVDAAETAAKFYDDQESAQREAERRAERAAQAQREMDEAILAGQTRAWDQAKDAAQAQVDSAKAMVDSVQANMDRIGQAATAGFSGSWFSGGDQQHGLWTGPGGGAAGDWRSRAMESISGLRERGSLISQLSGLGLSGAALEDLLGNQSNAGIAEMIAGGQIADFNALFSQRQALLASVGAQAGQAGYGADMASANAHLATMNAQFAALTAAIEAARPITVLEAISAQETARELARLLSMTGGA